MEISAMRSGVQPPPVRMRPEVKRGRNQLEQISTHLSCIVLRDFFNPKRKYDNRQLVKYLNESLHTRMTLATFFWMTIM
jgi:hypothetical protein